MNVIKYLKGDLVEALKSGEVQVIAHSCNCFNTMGSGVALAIKKSFPEAYAADCRTVKGDKEKLGDMSIAVTDFGKVFNLYGQYNYGKDGKQYTDYTALDSALFHMSGFLAFLDFEGSIGLPKIGAGIGGGDWGVIEEIIKDNLSRWEVNVYVL